MSEFLQRFFGSMGDYLLDHPGDPQVAQAAFPDWDVDPERLAIYGRFVRAHVRGVVGKVYPALRACVAPDVWSRWTSDYAQTRPQGAAYQLNGAAQRFPAFLEERSDAPAFAASLARFEWAKLGVYHARTPLPERVSQRVANPTLVMLEHRWRICAAYARLRASDPGAAIDQVPEAGDEIALIWRSPTTRLTRFHSATPGALLALKLAMESISTAVAAAAGGVSVAQVEEALGEWIEKGLVLSP